MHFAIEKLSDTFGVVMIIIESALFDNAVFIVDVGQRFIGAEGN